MIKNKIIVFTLLIAFLLVIFLKLADDNKSEGGAMLVDWFKKVDVHLCPEVKGRIVYQGEPVEGLKVLRQLVYNDLDVIKDEVITDVNGEFYFSEKNIKLAKRKLGFQYRATHQIISIIDKEKKYRLWDKDHQYRLWEVTQPETSPIPNFMDKLKNMRCDLDNPEVIFDFAYDEKMAVDDYYHYYGLTICRWDSDFSIRN